jgi:Double zinc ribbon domain
MSNSIAVEQEAETDDASSARSGFLMRFRPLAGLRRAVLDILLPPLCLGCQIRIMDHDALCPACWRRIDFVRPPLCDRLGVPLPFDTGAPMLSAAAVAEPPDYDRARAVARFDGLMRVLIHGFKFHDSHNATPFRTLDRGRRQRASFRCRSAGTGAAGAMAASFPPV